jgi:histone H3/H4
VKSYVRGRAFMASSDLPAALSARIQELLDRAIERCEGNGRRTVRSVDV